MDNSLFLKACRRELTERTPIWIMRQAGRYLPEYQAIRKKTDFMTLCKTPELASEVTVQPIDIIGVDAAILFSDILVIPEAMGMGLEIIESRGPVFSDPLRSTRDLDRLQIEGVTERLGYVVEAIKMTNEKLAGRVPLIGFSGAPWTLATYMIEGGSSKNFDRAKGMMYAEPEAMHRLLQILADAVIEYLNAKIEAGCHAVQIFDTWAGVLAPNDLEEFSLRYIDYICANLKTGGAPVIVFAKGMRSYKRISEMDCDVIGVDWVSDLGKVKQEIGDSKALQGNLDPCVLLAPQTVLEREVKRILDAYGDGPGHIFNLGHGILPPTPVENAKFLVSCVKELSIKQHKTVI
ncbi:MAG: uroporphyrinogen decarboxylase [Blastocatellia bacterium]|nr:uroporphyrinogen decarboxylase [Blastocatellia bacterium]